MDKTAVVYLCSSLAICNMASFASSVRSEQSFSLLSETQSPTQPSVNVSSRSSSSSHVGPGDAPSFSLQFSIRDVDFRNFTYPWPKDYIDPDEPGKKVFALRDGELPETRNKDGRVNGMGVSLVKIIYGDATGDGAEEAIIDLSILSGGSALPHIVYIYTLRNGRPLLLWTLSMGDRADDGLRRVYAENGKLVVESYSPIDNRGTCCPKYFDRTRYVWRANRFRQESKEKLLPNPEGHGSPIR